MDRKTACATIGADGVLRIPAEVLERAGLSEGAVVNLTAVGDGVITLVSENGDPDQWWFWTDEWQQGEREADADKASGRSEFFASDEEFRAAVVARMKQPNADS